MIIHIVKAGDTLYKISLQYGVPLDTIIEDNGFTSQNDLAIGQAVVVTTETIDYTVRAGNTLYGIAKYYGITLDALLNANPEITNPNYIYVGQVIKVPVGSSYLGSMEVNGYAVVSIDSSVYNKTLPYLTYASLFSYQVRADGTFNQLYETSLINDAYTSKVAPIMVITNIETGEGFSSEIGSSILNNVDIQNTLINNIVSTMQTKGYYGLNVDFEYLYPEDKDKYVEFLTKLTAKLHSLGFIVSVALAPKTSADQAGILYEAHDYQAIGAVVDQVILMTYEWGYLYGPPLPIAPIKPVKQVLDYAVSVIPREKIFMGMPNYAYDWTLPYVAGSAAMAITNTRALDNAIAVGATIKYDQSAEAPYYNYYDSKGKQHIVWFEDARSISARLALVKEYGIKGVSYWNINNFFRQNWTVLTNMYDVVKVIK